MCRFTIAASDASFSITVTTFLEALALADLIQPTFTLIILAGTAAGNYCVRQLYPFSRHLALNSPGVRIGRRRS
jgi:hypothetical protein